MQRPIQGLGTGIAWSGFALARSIIPNAINERLVGVATQIGPHLDATLTARTGAIVHLPRLLWLRIRYNWPLYADMNPNIGAQVQARAGTDDQQLTVRQANVEYLIVAVKGLALNLG